MKCKCKMVDVYQRKVNGFSPALDDLFNKLFKHGNFISDIGKNNKFIEFGFYNQHGVFVSMIRFNNP
jgi:hypothetical protein